MSREYRRYDPVPFPHDDRPIQDRFDHSDRIQTLNVDAAALAAALKREVSGEVKFDDGSRAMYATDASNYRQVPIGVVIPRHAEDVIRAIAVARSHGAPILAWGGGASLAGQCCNYAVVLDCSKYMSRIVDVNPQRRQARAYVWCPITPRRRWAGP